ncbi:MAG: nucleotidyltransferase domain-containing protein [Magnetococcales bacterium]|nr:nucleotidyltransferase domain-containing protein [Magnetococcales bacterium]
MRLTPVQIAVFKQLTREIFGPQAQVWLFGSRTDDQRRGGDIDLYICGYTQTSKEIWDAINRFAVQAQLKLGEQRIDVVAAPAADETPLLIHRVAAETGILL